MPRSESETESAFWPSLRCLILRRASSFLALVSVRKNSRLRLPLTRTPSMTYLAVGEWLYSTTRNRGCLMRVKVRTCSRIGQYTVNSWLGILPDGLSQVLRVEGIGGMAERFNAPVLKTGDPQGSVGSNPTPSAILIVNAYVESARATVFRSIGPRWPR